jgi:hypothetical protein
MRISRPRLLLRATLLLAGAAFMSWRASVTWPGLHGEALPAVLALVEALMGLLALVAAGVALRAMRPRPRQRTLRLPPAKRSGADPGCGPDPALPGGAGATPPKTQ